MGVMTPFGEVLRNIRLKRGLILKNMADALEMGSSQLSYIETG